MLRRDRPLPGPLAYPPGNVATNEVVPETKVALELTPAMIERAAVRFIVFANQERVVNAFGSVELELARRLAEAMLSEALRLDVEPQ